MTRLHRIHAAHAATRVEIEGITWRGDGGTVELKRAMAARLALAWNLCEGIPTELLATGYMRDIFQAVRDGDFERVVAMVAQVDDGTDRADGRLHDCQQCEGSDQ